MTANSESIKQKLTSEDLGERLRAVNQIRELEDKKIAFDLIQIATSDRNARVRYAAVSQMDTLGDTRIILARAAAADEVDLKFVERIDIRQAHPH